MKVLVAEDDAVSRLMFVKMLERMGHEPLQAEDGGVGIRLFDEHHPRLVITDWMMPHVDGLELCRHVRSQKMDRYCYVILITVKSGKWSYLEGMAAGADDFLTKPVDLDQLAARIKVAERILAGRE